MRLQETAGAACLAEARRRRTYLTGVMTAYRAAWVCPIDRSPIEDGIVEVDDGRIAAIGDQGSRIGDQGITELGNVAILPGLVNAHTHLELSWLRGRVPPSNSFTDWVKTLVGIRRGTELLITPEVVAPVYDAIRELRASGTVAVGDITNSLAAVEPMLEAGLHGVVFHELLGFGERDGALIEATRAPPRGVGRAEGRGSASRLMRRIRPPLNCSKRSARSCQRRTARFSASTLASRSKKWSCSRRAAARGAACCRPSACGATTGEIPACGPVQYLDRHGVIDARTLVVHGVQFDDAALDAAARARRHAGHLPAQQSLGGRRRTRRSIGSTPRACRSPSAPTASRASTTSICSRS